MGALNHVRSLAWAAIMAGLMAAMGDATADANPGTFEVDLLFPRNATYTPQALMPIVFAMQNPTLALPLGASIDWAFWEGNNWSSPGSIIDGVLELAVIENLSFSDPLLVTRFLDTFNYPDGFWTFAWSLTIFGCSQQGGQPQGIVLSGATTFTTSKSGQAPDLVAATSADMCGNTEAYAFDVISYGDSCCLLGPSPPTNPCAATINSASASSLYADATASACSPLGNRQKLNITCPGLKSKASAFFANAAGRSRIAAASTLLTLLVMLSDLEYLG